MKQMKPFIATLLSLLLLSSPLSSQQNRDEAKNLLDKAYSTFEASGGVKLTFRSDITDSDGTSSAQQSGKACMKGDKFKLETEELDIWFDGKTQWVLIKEANEVNISAPTASEISDISPQALLSGYRNGYVLKTPTTGTVNGRSVHLIDMTPVNRNRDIKSITAAIDRENGNIIRIILYMTDGMKNVIDISGYNTNHQFDDAMFRFDKNDYPDAEIIDLR
jgi:outer membrane lipoprotein-sorting protein